MDCRTILINNTDETLWFCFQCLVYPDSIKWTGNCLEDKVSPNSKKEVCTNDTWEERFGSYPTGMVRLLIISSDTTKLYNMTEIIEREKYYRKVDLSKEDLENMSWTISYP
jgi:hypothetical protein